MDTFKSLFERSIDGILICALDCTILQANQAACDLFGREKDDLVGRKISALVSMPPARDGEEVRQCGDKDRHRRVIIRPGKEDRLVELSTSFSEVDGQDLKFIIAREISLIDPTASAEEGMLRRFPAFFQHSLDGMSLVDSDGIVRDWNRSMERITGLLAQSVIGQPIWDVKERMVFQPTDQTVMDTEGHRDIVSRSLNAKDQGIFNQVQEVDLRNGKEGRRTVRQYLFPVPVGKETWVGSVIQDITEESLKRKEREVVEVRMRTILENVPAGIIIIDPADHKIVDANSAALAMIGGSREKVVGSVCHSHICPADVGKCPITDLGLKVNSSERKLVHLDKTTSPILKTVTTFTMDGRPLLLESFLDLREKKEMEAHLNEERERLAVTLRSIADGVITTTVDGNVELMNKAGEELTGWSQQDAAGRPLAEVFRPLHPQTRMHLPDTVAQIISSDGSTLAQDSCLITRDGRERMISSAGSAIRDGAQGVSGTVIIFRDITPQMRLEEMQLKAQKLEAVGTLAGGLAHDFNNILTAVLGNLGMVKLGSDLDERGRARLEEAERSIKRARGLTNQLLTFSKGGAPIKKVVSLATIIQDTAAFTLAGSNIRMHISMSDDLRDIEADREQISQVLRNIMVNAVEAMPGGGNVYITAANVTVGDDLQTLSPGDYVRMVISDDGPGLPNEHLDRLFDPYFTTKATGSGLGLAASYSIVRNHNGWITAANGTTSGLSLTIHLPAVSSRAAAPAPERTAPAPSRKMRILIMDDEEAILDVTSELLQHLGYEVLCAPDGATALRMYRDGMTGGRTVDLVIMDLTIPGGMGGKDAIVQLLAMDPEAKAIVSSGYSDNPVMADHTHYGFRGVMPKPYLIEEMAAEIQKVLSEQ